MINVIGVNGILRLRFGYDAATIEDVKLIPERSWNPTLRCWEVPSFYLPQLEDILQRWDVDIAKSAYDEYKKSITTDIEVAKTMTPEGFKGKLKPFQNIGFQWFLRKNGGILAGEMGIGKCLSGDTTILVNDCCIEIKDFYSRFGTLPKIGEKFIPIDNKYFIYSMDKNGQFIKKKIKNVFAQKVNENLLEISTKFGKKVKITKIHKLCVLDKFANIIEIESKKLKIKDMIVTARNIPQTDQIIKLKKPTIKSKYAHPKKTKFPTQVTPEFAELIGWMLTEGTEYKRGMFISQKKLSTITYIHNLAKKVFKRNFNIYKIKTRNIYNISFGIQVKNFLIENGYQYRKLRIECIGKKGSYCKKIPNFIMESDKQCKIAFVRGMFDGDGWISKNGFIELELTKSTEMMKQFAYILLSLGIHFKTKISHNSYGNRTDSVIISSDYAKKYAKIIGSSINYKQKKMDNISGLNYSYNHIVPKESVLNFMTFLENNKFPYFNSIQRIKTQNVTTKLLFDLVKGINGKWIKEYKRKKKNSENIKCKPNLTRINYVLNTLKSHNKELQHFKNIFKKIIELEKTIFFDEIKSIKEVKENYVFDIEVEDLHNFIGGEGIIFHNTVQTIAYMSHIHKLKVGFKPYFLVVVPNSIKKQWANEIRKFSSLKFYVEGGHEHNVKDKIDADVYIINYAVLVHSQKGYYLNKNWHTVFFDEAQYMKNRKAKRSIACKELKAKEKFALTGTPLENSPLDLYNITETVAPEFFGTFSKFASRYVTFENTQYGNLISGFRNFSELHNRMKPLILRRTKKEVLKELPPFTVMQRFVKLSLVERYKYKSLVTKAKNNSLFEVLTEIRLACNGTPEKSRKLEETMRLVTDILSQGNKKIVIFTQWLTTLKMIRAALKKAGISYRELHGEISVDQRQKNIDEFTFDESISVFLSDDAGAYGTNLQVASYLINFDLPWNPAKIAQRIGRIHRFGQQDYVTVYNIITENTIEERVLDILEAKQFMFDEVVENKNLDILTNKKMIRDLL